MLFPLVIGVAAGVAIQKYLLDDETCCKKKEKEKKADGPGEDEKEESAKSSIMDFINNAKRKHPALGTRRAAAKKLLLKLEGTEEEGNVSRETFDRTKTVVEEYCGLRNLEYDEETKTICGGEINEECPETPVLDSAKLDCLTKEELILIAPKLKELFKTEERNGDGK